MALSIQAGANSLLSIGVSISDIAAIVRHGRSFGNWISVQKNDDDLFSTIGEDYGIVLKRRGLVDVTLMQNRWSGQIHIVHRGKIDRILESGSLCKEQLGGFTWLMVALMVALDIVCLPPDQLRDLLTNVFVQALQREDTIELTDSFQCQIQTNIESWRSAGCIRGMKSPLSVAFKECRMSLVGHGVVPSITRAEKVELQGFVLWLLRGQSNQYRLTSATVYSLAAALVAAGVQLQLEAVDASMEGSIAVQYAGDGVGELAAVVEADWSTAAGEEGAFFGPRRVSFLVGKPQDMIEAFPGQIAMKNEMRKWWYRGAEAGAKVKIKGFSPLRMTQTIHYCVSSFDECTSSWEGSIGALADSHFPVTSQTLMLALDDFRQGLPDSTLDWIRTSASIGSDMHETAIECAIAQRETYLCYQSIVFGYWYKFLEQLITFEYITEEVYFCGMWGERDPWLLSFLKILCHKFRGALRPDAPPTTGPNREWIIKLIVTMYGGGYTNDLSSPGRAPVNQPGLMAVLGTISVVAISLLKVPKYLEDIVRFAIVSLPVIGLLPNQEGKLWSGMGSGIEFHTSTTSRQQTDDLPPAEEWTLHPKMIPTDGRPDKVVLAVRSHGILLGTISPHEADGLVIRALANRCGHIGARHDELSPPFDTDSRIIDVFDKSFQSGTIFRPTQRGQVAMVHTQGRSIMRYAAAGFYSKESHVFLSNGGSLESSLAALLEQFRQLKYTQAYGVIID